MSKKVLVKFNRPWAAYSRNDIAGFDEKTAEALIESKIADAYDPTTDGAAPAGDKAESGKGVEKGAADDANPPLPKKDGDKASGGKDAAKAGKDGAAPAGDK